MYINSIRPAEHRPNHVRPTSTFVGYTVMSVDMEISAVYIYLIPSRL
jgi:hypothetical protein